MEHDQGLALPGAERGRNLMKAERWKQVNDLFQSAVERAPGERAAFLHEACHGDEGLRREVDSLLTSYERAENFIELPAFEVAPELVTNDRAGALVGKVIGHYRIESLIGVGGMGEVYLARDERLGRKVALKLLPEHLTADETQLGRFKNEARSASALNHPNILTVYEIGAEGNRQFIATEFIEGVTLRALLADEKMNLRTALEIAVQVASALTAAHEAGVVHRDIKPENIMFRPDGYVKVLDFGIAKLAEQEVPVKIPTDEAMLLVETNLGSVLGTVRYMSPEQAYGAPVDKRTDVWSLGVVLYEMVTEHAPFTGDTPREIITSILEKEPRPLTSSIAQTPAELQQIISKALYKEREERYQSAHELLEALKDLRHKLEFEAELERSTVAPSWLSWTRSPTVLVLVLLVAALALAFPFYWHRKPPTSSIPEKSIAVLPFLDLSQAKENSYFAAGIQDDVLTSLAQIHDLKVISRTSVMAYQKPGGRNIREIGRALGVANVLEGSVRGTGNRVLVNVQLIDARNDRHLWAER